VKRSGEHDHQPNDIATTTKTKHIKGPKRVEMSRVVLEQYSGSAHAFVNAMHADATNIDIPSEEVVRKMVSEYIQKTHTEFPVSGTSVGFVQSLLAAADGLRSGIDSNQIHGYVQEFSIFPDLHVNLHSEMQIRACHSIPYADRILHMDASGGLCKVNKSDRNYSQILNYFFILKDSRDLSLRSFPIMEAITSRHNTFSISKMLSLFKFNYNSCFPKTNFHFRLVTSDFNYPTIHAALSVLNQENIFEYNDKVYDVATGSKSISDFDCSWLAQCISHTMHRFTGALKKATIFGKTQTDKFEFSTFCFSLLLNTVDFKATCKLFNYMVTLYRSEFTCPETVEALNILKEAMQNRPSSESEVKNAIKKVRFYNGVETSEAVDLENQPSVSAEQEDEDQINLDALCQDEPPCKETIKAKSKFGRDLIAINDAFKCSTRPTSEKNPFFNLKFINFFLDKFGPYIGLWASFTLIDLGLSDDHITNGTIEKFIGTRKGLVKSAFQLNRYVTETYTQAVGMIQRRNAETKNRKRPTRDEDAPEDMYQAVDTWGARPKSQLIATTREVGHYQAAPTGLFKRLEKPSSKKTATKKTKITTITLADIENVDLSLI
jgi:hypothetical protein